MASNKPEAMKVALQRHDAILAVHLDLFLEHGSKIIGRARRLLDFPIGLRISHRPDGHGHEDEQRR